MEGNDSRIQVALIAKFKASFSGVDSGGVISCTYVIISYLIAFEEMHGPHG